MHPDNIIKMKRKCPRCVLGDINNSEYRYRTGRNLPPHNHGEVYCNCGGHYGHEASGELSPEASLKRIIVSTESYRKAQRELPPSLPYPKRPEEPDWSKIGWEYFENLEVEKVIWGRWFPPNAENYRGILHPCGRFAGLGKVNNTELDRLDEEIRKEFKETCQRAADFGKGVGIGLLRNATELPFNLAGAIVGSSKIQSIPDETELPGVKDNKAYQLGKFASSAIMVGLGVAQVILGVGEIVAAAAEDVGGGALCATGVAAEAGAVLIVSSAAVYASGFAEVGTGVTLAVSGGKNLGGDFDEFRKVRSDRNEKISEPTSQNQMQKQVEKGQAPKDVDRVDKPHVEGQQPHVHFKDGTSLNQDGTVHDKHLGFPKLTKKTRDWLINNGWKVND